MGEQIAVSDAERERIGGTIGEAFGRNVRGVYGIAAERLRQRLVDEGDIGTILIY